MEYNKTELGKKLKCSNSHLLYHPDYPNSAIAIDDLELVVSYIFTMIKISIDIITSIEIF